VAVRPEVIALVRQVDWATYAAWRRGEKGAQVRRSDGRILTPAERALFESATPDDVAAAAAQAQAAAQGAAEAAAAAKLKLAEAELETRIARAMLRLLRSTPDAATWGDMERITGRDEVSLLAEETSLSPQVVESILAHF
jgi:hypothetical protein